MKNNSSVYSVYKDICQGYSQAREYPMIYVKHFNSYDIASVGEFYTRTLEHFKDRGAKTREDIIIEKIQASEWSQAEDKQIEAIERNISLMRDKKAKASIESQLDEIDGIISDYYKDLNPLINKKESFFVNSAETFTESAVTDYILSRSLFKNENCSIPYLELEEIEHLDQSELFKYINLYKELIGRIDYVTIRKIAVYPKFFTFFRNSNSAESFFGKAGKDLTQNQVILFECVKYFEKLIENTPNLTDEERSDPDELERAFILGKNAPTDNQDANLRSAFLKAKSFNPG